MSAGDGHAAIDWLVGYPGPGVRLVGSSTTAFPEPAWQTPAEEEVVITHIDAEYGPRARNRLAEAASPDLDGARAALESFYHAFNHRDLEAFRRVWVGDPLVQLNNPLGGILRGSDDIGRLYQRIFQSRARVEVSFGDIVAYQTAGMVVFAGRETGRFTDPGGRSLPLRIRTTRVFAYDRAAGRWGQVHHHGSIDDPDALRDYQDAVAAGS
jgi:ketosteroid isomerase-like protein